MYVTRLLSHYQKFPSSLSLPPPEGPNSGYLVIQDEESVGTTCFGLCKDDCIREMPFPQDKNLTVSYSTGSQEHRQNYKDHVYFIPVLNEPLSSNRYYVIKARGRHTGEAFASSSGDDEATCCCFNFVTDLKPRELDHEDVYQQIEIAVWESCLGSSGYVARSVAQDGIPPRFLARKGWKVYASTPRHYQLSEAQGVNTSLRARLPRFEFPLSSNKSSETMVVGKWDSPFMFIKEEEKLKDQMKRSMFYEITLQQQWKQIYECENHLNDHNFVVVDVSVQREVALLSGAEALHNHTNVTEGVIWFSTVNGAAAGGESSRVGLSSAVVKRMRWEQERVGWVGGKENQVRVERVEEFQGGKNGWKKYGCYVLVERFVFKRMDGSLLLTYEYRHAHQIRGKWE
ncbi:hypothetical protein NE237_021880 [Protea cynaroides]|uniref:Insecticidal crystal toxin domain-containing protein n=1 Tax=Protea cynaroides TaxID=273540 RepID=A0A9Q0K4S9_9MAGN|nr:hypothetical protein NE237_021880 [Protea cynaroides]